MSRSRSLQRRLGVGLAAGVTVVWLLAALGATVVIGHELDEALDSALQETAQRLLPLAARDVEDRRRSRRLPALEPHDELLTYVVRDAAGDVVLQSHDARPQHFPRTRATGFTNTATHRIYSQSAMKGALLIQVAEPRAHRGEAVKEAAVALLVPVLVLVPVSLLGVWWFVRRSLRPVVDFERDIGRRGAGDLSPVPTTGLPAELAPVARAVNALMERLMRALDSERAFTANSAHELRTPIAAILAQIQRLLAESDDGPTRERARQIEASLHRLSRLAEKLMQLARAEGGGLIGPSATDLSPVLSHVVEEFARQDDLGQRVRLALAEAKVPASHLDPDAFAILVRNLVENALLHGDPGAPVEVIQDADGCVRVVNDGPVVPDDVLAGLTARFARGDSRAGGSGLGLAIAEAIARGAGGRLVLRSPAGGRDAGFEAAFHPPA